MNEFEVQTTQKFHERKYLQRNPSGARDLEHTCAKLKVDAQTYRPLYNVPSVSSLSPLSCHMQPFYLCRAKLDTKVTQRDHTEFKVGIYALPHGVYQNIRLSEYTISPEL